MDPEFDALFTRHRRDAVLLHRPYPPHTAPRTNSHLGGLPRLPAHHDWPRTREGRPLHFLAQIDCADLPFPTPLPDRGVLFFFGRDDAEQVWNFYDVSTDDCRVLYVLDASAATDPRPVPADLPPIGDEYPGPTWRDFLREGEAGPNVHIQWPVTLARIDSWPDSLPEAQPPAQDWRSSLLNLLRSPPPPTTWQEESALLERYCDQLDERRAAAFTAATGERSHQVPGPNQDGEAARAIFFHAAQGPDAYPQHWAMIHYAARALLHRPSRFSPTRDPKFLARMIENAEGWLARAAAVGLDATVSPDDKTEFRACLEALRKPRYKQPLGYRAENLIFASLTATIRAWAGDPGRAARVPPHVYEALRFHFNGFEPYGLKSSQMLGHAPSAQESLSLDDPTICLLNLASEQAMGWMFGDVGNASFWITPADLARRDFTKVWATIEGH